jgi:hypothetical protein
MKLRSADGKNIVDCTYVYISQAMKPERYYVCASMGAMETDVELGEYRTLNAALKEMDNIMSLDSYHLSNERK